MSKKTSDRSYKKNSSIIELFRMFPDEATSRKWFESIRWPNGERHCPHCGSLKTSVVKGEKPMPYHCAECREYFSVKAGTVMQSSKVPLQKWVIASYLLSTSLKGLSSMKLHRDLGVTQKTAWALAQKIREGWIDGSEKLTGSVEVDETYIGVKEKNKHKGRRLKAGRGTAGKTAIIGAKKRGGKIKAKVIEKTDTPTLQGFVTDNVEGGATVVTDEHVGYKGFSRAFQHQFVRHTVGEHVNGLAHTNGVESFWAMLKRGYRGRYRKMSLKHLSWYVGEFAGHHNVRDRDALAQMVALVRGLHGRHLRYDDLVVRHG